MSNPDVVKINIVFVDGSTGTWASSSSEEKYARAEFLSAKYLAIDGENFNADYVFSWKFEDAKEKR